ncbi:helix-turn-helix transcriptional regulator [Flavobacterium sp. Fl-318]|uniref:Helix-turn-helix transcriptional regulator n=1 Tax=Flavobacterium cupriresistens TaxID=2893885 RepID=A0ABU4RHW7_9FLAO|nr:MULTISPECIES: helix-turn-helix transcriptional regulator [unclassified Flavobacterium]MDX6191095.1 helix-turn-helix transcriptional regulator [Flavobacterium sp. Fl-318]UFH42584.1 helix-turn-helix domain-containing protein [Flavobacterium sp. F-323]
MKANFDIESIIDSGFISNELDYERALIADRKLRLLAKESIHFKNLRSKLRDLIAKYESSEWSDVNLIDESKLLEVEKFEQIAELERVFIENRKQSIRKKLKELDLTQENLATLLGHKSKTHMSELVNGIKPFTLKDLVIINRILKIDVSLLIPLFLSNEEQLRVKEAVKKLDKPKVKLNVEDLLLS